MHRLLDELRSGETVYLPGATGEIAALTSALGADPERMRGVHILSCLLPGINWFDYAALDETARVTTFLLPPALRPSFEAGRVRVMPLSYSATARYIGEAARIDAAVAHVSLPDGEGYCSFGIAADFSPIAWRRARRRIAVVNPKMPAMARGPRVRLAEADLVVEQESPLVEVAARIPCPRVRAIARAAAAMIPDGAAIQLGIGGVPGAMCSELAGHRGLRIQSGLVPEGVRTLAEAGALAEPAMHRTGIAVGPARFYDYLRDSDLVAFDETGATHDPAALAGIGRFHAINGALEVDLLGQVNVEWQQGRLTGGVGGAPDFTRAAAASHGGRSMILLPSTAREGAVSRIVPRIEAPAASLTRTETDTIVTEYGYAELRRLSMDERAQALIGLAAERFRGELERSWRQMRSSM